MTHAQAEAVLTRLLEGDLDADSAAQLRDHLTACPECTAAVEGYEALTPSFKAPDAFPEGSHPSSDLIVEYAARPETLSAGDELRVARHIGLCASCSGEVNATRAMEAETGRPGRSTGPTRSRAPSGRKTSFQPWLSLAAGLGFLVLAYPSYLGIVFYPSLQQRVGELGAQREALEGRISSLESRLAAAQEQSRTTTMWSGPIELSVLASSLREGTPGMRIGVREGQPYVVLAVQPPVPEDTALDASCRFKVRRLEGSEVWSSAMPASEARARIADAGAIALLVPTSLLPAGRYELIFTVMNGTTRRPRLQIPFEVGRLN